MGVTMIPAPRQSNTDGQMLQFLMQLMSAPERTALAEDRARRTDIAEEQLGISRGHLDVSEGTLAIAQAGEARTAAAFKAAKPELKGRKRLIQRYALADREVAKAQRAYDVAKTTKDTAKQASAARTLSNIKSLYGDNAAMLETILFAKEKSMESGAQLDLARQGALSANQTTEMLKMALNQQKRTGDARLDAITNVVKMAGGAGGDILAGNVERFLDPSQSSADIIADIMRDVTAGKQEITDTARQAKWIDPSKFTEKEKEKFDPQSLAQYEDAFRNTGRGVETMTIPRPKDQRRFWYRDSNELTLTRKRAVEIGVSDLWDAAKTKEAAVNQKGTGANTLVTPTKRKTVKELANEKAKRVKTTKGKAVSKPASKGGYTVGQVIEAGGKKYKVTGFDTDGEPLVAEVK